MKLEDTEMDNPQLDQPNHYTKFCMTPGIIAACYEHTRSGQVPRRIFGSVAQQYIGLFDQMFRLGDVVDPFMQTMEGKPIDHFRVMLGGSRGILVLQETVGSLKSRFAVIYHTNEPVVKSLKRMMAAQLRLFRWLPDGEQSVAS